MLKIYHNARCSKSRQGLELVKDSGEEFEVVDYLKNPPSTEDIKELLQLLGIPAIDLVRKNEAIWKENYKEKTLSEDEVVQAMHENPKLIERPIVIKDEKAVIGRPPELVKDLL